MKKFIVTAISVFAIVTIANAQRGFTAENKVIVGHSWTVGNTTVEKKVFHPYVQVGRSGIFNFSPNVAVGLGTYFSTEGLSFKDSAYNINGERFSYKGELRTNYIRIPLMAAFTFGNARNCIRPRVSVGPTIGFLVGGKTLINTSGALSGHKTLKTLSTTIDAGVNAAVGISVRLFDGVWVNHDINYYHGIIENEYNKSVINGPNFTHRNIGLSMGMVVDYNAMNQWKNKMHGGKKGWRR